MSEAWKDIPGYEGRYQASTSGRIRSVDHYVRCGKNGKGSRLVRGRVLRPGRYCKAGHISVVLGKGTNGRPVHQLVALTFLGPVPDGMEVLHNDGNPTNNQLRNLRYGTRTENILDVYRIGRAWRKLTVKDAGEIRDRLKAGESVAHLAREYAVARITISRIRDRRTFAWLT